MRVKEMGSAILAIIAAICLCIGIDNNWEIEDM
jgi:hypothetical protein